jgi:hypothetical protein
MAAYWLQIQRSWFNSRCYQICSAQKVENNAVGISHADYVAPYIRKKLALTSPTSDGRSVRIVRSRTEATEYYLLLGHDSFPLNHFPSNV